MAQPNTALAEAVTSEAPTPADVYGSFYGEYQELGGWACPNLAIRGEDDQMSTIEAFERMVGRYVDRIHELPDDVKFATGAMPMAPHPVPFILGPQASGTR